MPLSLSELKDRAIRFAQEWQDETDERAGAQSFWTDFSTGLALAHVTLVYATL